MSARRTISPASALPAVWVVVATSGLVLAWLNRSLKGSTFGLTVFFTAISSVYVVVGILIAARTRHRIGWLLLTLGIAFPLGGAAEQYTLYGLVTSPGSVPGTTAAALSIFWFLGTAIAALVSILLVFPSGSVRSPRWRPVLAAVPVASVLYIGANCLTSNATHGPWSDHGVNLVNPIAPVHLAGVLRGIFIVGASVVFGCGVAGIASIVVRFRGARGTERQQIKWLAYVGVAATLLFVGQFGADRVAHLGNAASNFLWAVFFSTLMLGIPLSIGAAVLRYRLYDIDRVISRTLSYAIVTALLVGAYAGLVVLFQATTRPLLGRSDLAIAASTLIVAAMFVPLRRRVQNVVDHRFNRKRYDAEHTIEAFSARLRDEVDIDTLGAELATVIGTTMQPAHMSLWLKDART